MPAELAPSLTATEAERLEQAEGLVRGFCGWHIAPSRANEFVTLHPEAGSAILTLPSLYVTSVSVTREGLPLVVDTDYSWSEAGVLTSYWWGTTPIEVTFTHGYQDVPPEVTAVVQAVAQRAVDNPGSVTRTQAGPFSDSFSQTGSGQTATLALLDAEREILNRYRIPPRP